MKGFLLLLFHISQVRLANFLENNLKKLARTEKCSNLPALCAWWETLTVKAPTRDKNPEDKQQ